MLIFRGKNPIFVISLLEITICIKKLFFKLFKESTLGTWSHLNQYIDSNSFLYKNMMIQRLESLKWLAK